MYSEENENLAQTAYNNWRQTNLDAPSWLMFPNKPVWRDLIEEMQKQRPLYCTDDREQACYDVIYGGKVEAPVDLVSAPPSIRFRRKNQNPEKKTR